MSSVVARCFASVPARSADATWTAIVEMLTRGQSGTDRDELLAVIGTASSLIVDQAPKDVAIIVTCEGPRTRIRCIYDENAVSGSGVNESALGFDPLAGEWAMSLPCPAEDLSWVQASLARHSTRVTARDLADTGQAKDEATTAGAAFEIDAKGFFG